MSETNDGDLLTEVATDIKQRLDALGERLDEMPSDDELEQRVREILDGLLDDEEAGDEIRRKIRFGAGGATDRDLVGTKYARWGLSIADVEFLHDMQTSLRGQRKPGDGGAYEGPSEDLDRTFKAISDAAYLTPEQVAEMDRKAIDNLFPRIPLGQFNPEDRAHAARGDYELTGAYQRAIRAMDTAETGYGLQLVGAQYVGELWEAPRALGKVFPRLNSFEMTDPTAYLPVEADLPEMLFVAESTASDSSNYATTKSGSNRVQVDAKKFVIHQMWSGEMEEDSIIAYVPFLRGQAAKSLAHYTDSLVVNGDTTNAATGNINLDDADPADTKHYLAFDGMRHAALVDATGQGAALATITYDALVAMRGDLIDRTYLMDWSNPVDPMSLVYFCDPEAALVIAQLDDVQTVDKYGPQATVLTGEVAKIGRNPLVSTVAMPLTEADGKVSTTGSNNTKGGVLLVNTGGYVAGWRRRVRLETERLPASDQTRLVYSLRLGLGRFSPTGAAAAIKHTALRYNSTV